MKPASSISLGITLLTIASCSGQVVDPRSEASAPAATLHRLTVSQYQNTVRELFGADIEVPELEPDLKIHGYTSIATGELTVSPRATELYEAAARRLSQQVVTDTARRRAVIACDEPEASCLREAFARLGRRAWRRPLSEDEISVILNVVETTGASLNDPWLGVEYGLSVLLESPHFLYRVELGVPDESIGNRRRLDGYEIASRLSFVLWDRGPDDELLDLAGQGQLDSADEVRACAARMLEDERGRAALASFFGEYLNLDRLDGISKDAELFPQMTPGLSSGMRGELLRLFSYIVFEGDGDYRKIFTTPIAFVNAELAELYGVEAPSDGEDFAERELGPDALRAGLLTSAGLMALYAHNSVTSPTLRGRFVRQNLLCEDIAPPPPGVVTTLEGAEGSTIRERLAQHATNEVCASCHQLMDPIGLAFEAFDPIGGIRSEEAPGVAIDSTGNLDGVEVHSARELAQLVAQDPRMPSCFVTQFYRHATGHLESDGELALLARLSGDFESSGLRVRDLVVALAGSDAFRYAAAPLDEAPTSTEPEYPSEESP